MKRIILVFTLLGIMLGAYAQRKHIDTLRAELSKNLDDTTRINKLIDLSRAYYISMPDSNIILSLQAYDLATKHNLVEKQARALNNMATAYATLGDYAKGAQFFFRALRIDEQIGKVPEAVIVYNNLGDTYMRQGDYKKALSYLIPGINRWKDYIKGHKIGPPRYKELVAIFNLNIGECYLYTNKIDSADHFLQESYRDSKEQKFGDLLNNIERDFGEIEISRGHPEAALKHLRDAVAISITNDDTQMLSESYLSTAKVFHNNKQQDSAEYYAQKALDVAVAGKFEPDILNAGKVLYAYYDEDHNLPLAYKYYRMATTAKDSIYSQDRVKQLLSLDFEEKQRQQEIAAAKEQYRDSVRMYSLIAGMIVLVVLAFIFWRANKARTKAYNLLHKQKDEIDFQKAKVEHTLAELKSTQNQLVQSAKMASLGELTAGIAHEIQNPLNFVNNFSEVSAELTQELKDELKSGHTEDALAIADNLEQNLGKINHHGKRADAIVKGMLQHSQTGSGAKELININSLADEYLRLSYHGLRAKDKSFNAELITHYDEHLPKVNVIPQDMGRVMLNLFNNAFYAVSQKQKTGIVNYKPEVTVTTLTENRQLIIKVKDNGVGMSEHVKEKIMQPFFTTKPTGEGTGLGLSLTYDMVVKGHAGSIQVNSIEGEGSEFIIQLPMN